MVTIPALPLCAETLALVPAVHARATENSEMDQGM